MNWRRAIALVLIAVFLPASSLAGASIKHCVAANGHSELEFVIAGLHSHPHEGHENHSVNDSTLVAERAVASDLCVRIACSDSELLSASHQAQDVEQVKPDLKKYARPLVELTALERAGSAARLTLRDLPQADRQHPQLALLRTIVLLI